MQRGRRWPGACCSSTPAMGRWAGCRAMCCWRSGRSKSKPARHDDFLLGVKRDGIAAVRVEIAEEGILPTGEREKRHGSGDPDIDADHSYFDAVGVLPGGFAVRGKDGSRVSEARAVDQRNRV